MDAQFAAIARAVSVARMDTALDNFYIAAMAGLDLDTGEVVDPIADADLHTYDLFFAEYHPDGAAAVEDTHSDLGWREDEEPCDCSSFVESTYPIAPAEQIAAEREWIAEVEAATRRSPFERRARAGELPVNDISGHVAPWR